MSTCSSVFHREFLLGNFNFIYSPLWVAHYTHRISTIRISKGVNFLILFVTIYMSLHGNICRNSSSRPWIFRNFICYSIYNFFPRTRHEVSKGTPDGRKRHFCQQNVRYKVIIVVRIIKLLLKPHNFWDELPKNFYFQCSRYFVHPITED